MQIFVGNLIPPQPLLRHVLHRTRSKYLCHCLHHSSKCKGAGQIVWGFFDLDCIHDPADGFRRRRTDAALKMLVLLCHRVQPRGVSLLLTLTLAMRRALNFFPRSA